MPKLKAGASFSTEKGTGSEEQLCDSFWYIGIFFFFLTRLEYFSKLLRTRMLYTAFSSEKETETPTPSLSLFFPFLAHFMPEGFFK